MLTVLLDVIAPVFLVIGTGVLLGRLVRADLPSLSRVALYGTTPALVFTSMSDTELAAGSALVLALGQLLAFAVMFVLARSLSKRIEPRRRRGFVASNLFVNSGNLMLPVSLFAFGDAGLQRALLLYVVATVLIFLLGPLALAGRSAMRADGLRRVLQLPVLWAALLGIAFGALGWSLPLGLERGVRLLGDAAIPLVLLILGLQIHRAGPFVPRGLHATTAAVKLLAGPVVAYAAARVVGAEGLDLAILTLFGAMPPAVNVFVLALEFEGEGEEIARMLMLTTVASLVTIPLVITLLERIA